ncbi:hypothetical protein ACFL2R_00245 [Patescibacteria group bacterium]
MNTYSTQLNSTKTIVALGAESAGNFSIFHNNTIHHSSDFGNLQDKDNFEKFKTSLLTFIKKNKLKPDAVLTDLHPYYVTTEFGQELSQELTAEHIQIQHHHAHIFASIGDYLIEKQIFQLPEHTIGIAMDGTGFGLDEKIWGGELFDIDAESKSIKRIGHLENQILLGSELAIKEPARMLISILSNFLSKKETFKFIKAYYDQNQFELLYSQLKQDFNCQEASSTGRALDAVSILLGFSKNSRGFKHAPIKNLVSNSTIPYSDLKPSIIQRNSLFTLETTPLFEYLVQNINKDKKRLAATAQKYIAEGFYGITEKSNPKLPPLFKGEDQGGVSLIDTPNLFISGGVASSKIISDFFHEKGAWDNKKVPRGDAGLSLGQIFYYLIQI